MQENILLFCHVAFESDIKIICDDGYRSAARPKWCWLMEGHIPDSQVKLSEGSPTLIRLDVAGEKKKSLFFTLFRALHVFIITSFPRGSLLPVISFAYSLFFPFMFFFPIPTII